MNHLHHYQVLCEKRKKTPAEGYTESHHIVPKCLGGSDGKSNRVRLTPEEHYVAHLLLKHIYPEEKGLWYAIMRMSVWGSGSRLYGKLRREEFEERRL